ncbi:MAG TPA: PIN domain-containing protein [Stellaceae bacterium]
MDTGPLVAYLSRRDAYHEWAVEQFAALDPPIITCEAVLTEACFVAARSRISPPRLLDFVANGALAIGLELQEEASAVRGLMMRYADIPMSFADACLVRLAEITGLSICTLDGDFAIYRAHGRRPLRLIAPDPRRGLHES